MVKKINKGQLQEIIRESVREVLREDSNDSADYDILYRGIGVGQMSNVPVLWLTTSPEYAKNYGDRVLKYRVPMSVLDSLANEKEALKYLTKETDGFQFYEAENFDIEQMKADGFTGYYYQEAEYKCLNACLFNKNDAKPILERNNPLAENRKKIRKIIITESQMNTIMGGERFNIKGVYHVSSESFDKFRIGAFENGEKTFPYLFFSSKPIVLCGAKNVYVCNLSMHKPFRFEHAESWSYPLWLYLTDRNGQLIPEEEFTEEKFDGYLGCPYEFWKMVYYDEDEWETDQIPYLVKALDMGYDGVIITNVYEGDTGINVDDYIVFDPEQIEIVGRRRMA